MKMIHIQIKVGLVFLILMVGYGSSASKSWTVVEQSELAKELEQVPLLQTESLGEPARGVNVWERWMVPNPDGKSWDVLQIYFKEYYGPTWLYAIDLGSGQVKRQRLADDHQFYLSGRALGFDGKYYIAMPSRKTWSMDLFVYDPATNTMEERGEIVPGLGGEVRPLVTGPDGRIYGTGTRDNKVGLYIYDPKLGKVVKDYGAVGPAHPNGAWSRYVMGVDDTHAYIASGMIPAWYLVAVNLATGEEKVLLESPTERVMDILESFPSCYARVPQENRQSDKEYWLYHGQAIPKTSDTPPWARQESPWEKAAPRPQVYFDQIDPDSEGRATLWYRLTNDSEWKPIRLEEVPSYPHRINAMSLLPDGRIFGTGDDYAGVFTFDPRTDKAENLGPRPGLAPYTQIVCGDKLYSSGYSGGHLFVYDPAKPWTLSKGGPPGQPAIDQGDPRSNPRYLGDFDRTTRVGLMHSSALGVDGKVYFGGFGLRHYTGGGLGWYDPKTQKMDGIWKPLSGYAVRWVTAAIEGRLIVLSTSTAPDEQNDNRQPDEAKLFVYDVGEGKIVREFAPLPKARTTGLILEVAQGRFLGLTSDPKDKKRSILYGVDVTTGETLFTKVLPSSVSMDDYWPHWVDPSYEYNTFERGPDGWVWTWLRDVLVRVDPNDGRVQAVGKVDPVGWPTIVGNDVYFSGSETLRRIRNIVPTSKGAAAVPNLGAVIQLLLGGVAATQEAKVTKFQFGTAASASRAGYVKVTIKDPFTPDKGYGFQSTDGLMEFDRGGSAIERPKDEYTASVYGAYRTTSDMTCAGIEGTKDNVFVAALPDGEYTVWLIASDAECDPPLFEVWANGQKKLAVRIPRRAFVFLEPFHAQATDGQLRIEFKGPHGWILSGLVIGKDGPELADVVGKLDRDIFFLTDPELPNWKEAKESPANPPLELTPDERERGYVIFPVDYTAQIVPSFVPARSAIGKPLMAMAALGEFEPATFCISAQKDMGNVAVELSDFVAEKGSSKIGRERVSVGVVRCWPQRASDWGGKGEYRIVPEMIEPASECSTRVQAGQVKQWWLTVHVPPDTATGRYRMTLTIRPQNAAPIEMQWRLLVLPFQLVRPADQHWGTWLDSFPPVGRLWGPERRGRVTPEEIKRVADADIADYRDHGFDLALLNYYFGVDEKPDGSFSYGLSTLPEDMEYLKRLGSDAPVVICFEYACRNLEYGFAEKDAKHVPGTFSPKAHKAIVGLVQAIRDEAQRSKWPQIYFFPIDEPGNNKTENRYQFAERVLDFVHEVPGCTTAVTVTADCVRRLGEERIDARIYAYGHYNRNKVLQDAKRGHPFWYYENGMFYAHTTIGSRNMTGFEFLRSGAEVATAWGFAATQANPYNDFDGGHKDWNVIFPGVDRPTPTIYWELCREGVDDCRYVATLQQQIRQAKDRGATDAAQRAEKVLAPLIAADAEGVENPAAFGRLRWRVAREILALQGDRELALPFAAVADNPASPIRLGPNLVANPSFEEPAGKDGSPPGSYHLGFPTTGEKPMEALRVTDEAAHSGRFSMKWDLSKVADAEYKGRDPRWLVINVGFSSETVKSVRGKRVKVGYWMRVGGGTTVPGLGLRQNLKDKPGDGIFFRGGVEDPAVWNHFEAEGRLSDALESMDIHTWVSIPQAELAKTCYFYMDDISLEVVEELPVSVSTPLDEYYEGESIPWTVNVVPPGDEFSIALRIGDRVVLEQTHKAAGGLLQGVFESRGLACGVYTIETKTGASSQDRQSAKRQIILAPNPWEK